MLILMEMSAKSGSKSTLDHNFFFFFRVWSWWRNAIIRKQVGYPGRGWQNLPLGAGSDWILEGQDGVCLVTAQRKPEWPCLPCHPGWWNNGRFDQRQLHLGIGWLFDCCSKQTLCWWAELIVRKMWTKPTRTSRLFLKTYRFNLHSETSPEVQGCQDSPGARGPRSTGERLPKFLQRLNFCGEVGFTGWVGWWTFLILWSSQATSCCENAQATQGVHSWTKAFLLHC